MSASSHSFSQGPQAPDVLDELLHALSQPLTTLRCSLELELESELELSSDERSGKQQKTVSVALQQTETVIGMVQLMREYLDAEQRGPEIHFTALAPALRKVIEELSSIAAVRSIQLRLLGSCAATVSVPEPRLRLALQYLVAPMIEAESSAGRVTLLLGEGPAGAVLRVEGTRGLREMQHGEKKESGSKPQNRDPARATSPLRRARLSIATRVLEASGASLVFGDDAHSGFVLRVPRQNGAPD